VRFDILRAEAAVPNRTALRVCAGRRPAAPRCGGCAALINGACCLNKLQAPLIRSARLVAHLTRIRSGEELRHTLAALPSRAAAAAAAIVCSDSLSAGAAPQYRLRRTA
jgi:hypothetical protein